MPYLKLQTSKNVFNKREVIQKLSGIVAEELGKPESYVMVALESEVKMCFGGDTDPAIFMQLKSIGLSESMTDSLSEALCTYASEKLNIDSDRIYIEFTDVDGSFWGWNKSTF